MNREEEMTELLEVLGDDDSYLSDRDYRQALRQFAGLRQAGEPDTEQSPADGDELEPLV